MPRFFLLIFLLWLPSLVAAEEETKFLELGGDLYGGGSSVIATNDAVQDVFLAGQDSTLAAPITGSAHMAGQTVTVSESVAGSVYAAGQTITLSGPVAGSATLAGQTVTVDEVGRNLRAFGQTVSLNGPLGGSGLITAQTVKLNGTVAGDLMVNAMTLDFGPDAAITGALTLYHPEPDTVTVPDTVIAADKITRKTVEDWSKDAPTAMGVSRGAIWRGFLSSVVTITVLAALLAALIPARLAEMRGTFLSRPFRSFWFGFLTLSATIGTTIVLAMTLVGLLAAPLTVVMALLAGFAGYIVGAYAVGVGLLALIGRAVPKAWAERAIAAAVGAVVIAAIGLVPFFGWLVVLAVTLTGLGAVCIALFRPGFYTDKVQSA